MDLNKIVGQLRKDNYDRVINPGNNKFCDSFCTVSWHGNNLLYIIPDTRFPYSGGIVYVNTLDFDNEEKVASYITDKFLSRPFSVNVWKLVTIAINELIPGLCKLPEADYCPKVNPEIITCEDSIRVVSKVNPCNGVVAVVNINRDGKVDMEYSIGHFNRGDIIDTIGYPLKLHKGVNPSKSSSLLLNKIFWTETGLNRCDYRFLGDLISLNKMKYIEPSCASGSWYLASYKSSLEEEGITPTKYHTGDRIFTIEHNEYKRLVLGLSFTIRSYELGKTLLLVREDVDLSGSLVTDYINKALPTLGKLREIEKAADILGCSIHDRIFPLRSTISVRKDGSIIGSLIYHVKVTDKVQFQIKYVLSNDRNRSPYCIVGKRAFSVVPIKQLIRYQLFKTPDLGVNISNLAMSI